MALKVIQKGKYTNYISDPGVCVFPYLNFPAKFNKSENKSFMDPDGDYSVKLRFKKEDVADLIELLDEKTDEAFDKAKSENPKMKKAIVRQSPWSEEMDESGDNPTGYVLVKFKIKGRYESKKAKGTYVSMKPSLFDTQGTPITAEIWGGSVVRINFYIADYFVSGNKMAGVSLKPQAVQVVDLVTKGQQSAEGYGFEQQEGYVSSGEDNSTGGDDADGDVTKPEGDDDGYSDGDF